MKRIILTAALSALFPSVSISGSAVAAGAGAGGGSTMNCSEIRISYVIRTVIGSINSIIGGILVQRP